MDSFPLPIDGSHTTVTATNQANEFITRYTELEDAVGSSPHYFHQ